MGAREVFGMDQKQYVLNMGMLATPVNVTPAITSRLESRKPSSGIKVSKHANRSSWENFGVVRDQNISN